MKGKSPAGALLPGAPGITPNESLASSIQKDCPYPVVDAVPIGEGLLRVVCPFCSTPTRIRTHFHGDADGDGGGWRLSHCCSQEPKQYFLRIVTGDEDRQIPRNAWHKRRFQ